MGKVILKANAEPLGKTKERRNMTKKAAEHAQFKLRVQQSLLKRLRKEAAKKGHSANNEAVERLEQSLEKDTRAMRDGAVIDMLVRHNEVSASILRDIADEIAKHPDWNRDEAARKDLVGWLYIAAHGKEPIEEPQPGDDK
jgi:plasmid stability protein